MPNHPMTTFDRTGERDCFEIGGENLLQCVSNGDDANRKQEILDEMKIRIGTLLKTENVSFLHGAGASVGCGGPLIGSIPLVVERALHKEGITGGAKPRIRDWLKVFYLAVCRAGGGGNVPTSRDSIVKRNETLNDERTQPLPVNFEQVLALLSRWRFALPECGGRLHLDGPPEVTVTAEGLDKCLTHATRALACACALPTDDKATGLATFKTLLRKLLTRPLNLKRVNIFTLNYDTLVEKAADAEGVVLLDGFVGTCERIFRPESYEQDLYFPAETTEGRVHRFDRVVHLHKLHGSISWVATEATIDNPYGIISRAFESNGTSPLLIYPTPSKYGETLGMPYSEMFRRFAATLVRPQSVLFVIGYGFGDEHVNAIIRQALAVPSFILVVVDPNPTSEFVETLRGQKDLRVWIIKGPSLGEFTGFVEQVLPDLREEEIRKKVLATWRALKLKQDRQGDESNVD